MQTITQNDILVPDNQVDVDLLAATVRQSLPPVLHVLPKGEALDQPAVVSLDPRVHGNSEGPQWVVEHQGEGVWVVAAEYLDLADQDFRLVGKVFVQQTERGPVVQEIGKAQLKRLLGPDEQGTTDLVFDRGARMSWESIDAHVELNAGARYSRVIL